MRRSVPAVAATVAALGLLATFRTTTGNATNSVAGGPGRDATARDGPAHDTTTGDGPAAPRWRRRFRRRHCPTRDNAADDAACDEAAGDNAANHARAEHDADARRPRSREPLRPGASAGHRVGPQDRRHPGARAPPGSPAFGGDQRVRRAGVAPGGSAGAECADRSRVGRLVHELQLRPIAAGRARPGRHLARVHWPLVRRVEQQWGTAISVDVRDEIDASRARQHARRCIRVVRAGRRPVQHVA